MMLAVAEASDFRSLTGFEDYLTALILPGSTVAFPRLSAFVLCNHHTSEQVRSGIVLNYVTFGGAEVLWGLMPSLPSQVVHAEVKLALVLAANPDGLTYRFGVPEVPVLTLNVLGLHPHPMVRVWVAERIRAGVVFHHLVHDANPLVRCAVAGRTDAPGGVLAELAEDSNVSVRLGVARNVGASGVVLRGLAGDVDSLVRGGVALNPGCPVDVLGGLLGDGSLSVVMSVVRNPGLPVVFLRGLCDHEVEAVRLLAASRLRGG
jgi:hypothetical protein